MDEQTISDECNALYWAGRKGIFALVPYHGQDKRNGPKQAKQQPENKLWVYTFLRHESSG